VISGDDKWYTVATAILAAANGAITKAVNRALITTGQIAWDDCCDGQLAVSVTRVAPTEAFPTEQVTLVLMGSCSPAYELAEISVQIVRCAPQALNGQQAPTVTALSDAAKQTLIDANQVRRSVTKALCSLKEDIPQRLDYFIRDQLFLGPEGACAGSELRLYAGLAVG
jgi:hypothetical protein